MFKSSTLPSGLLFVLSVAGVAFYSGFRPAYFATTFGWFLLILSMISPFLFLLSLRAENISWKVSLTIVGILLASLIMIFFVPSWYFFTYLPSMQALPASP